MITAATDCSSSQSSSPPLFSYFEEIRESSLLLQSTQKELSEIDGLDCRFSNLSIQNGGVPFQNDNSRGFEELQVIQSNEASKVNQGRLLLVSLLENFCDMYDRRPDRNRKLYFALCKRLSSMGILLSSDFVDEAQTVRKAYRNVFKDLVMEAIESIKNEDDLPPPPPVTLKLLDIISATKPSQSPLMGGSTSSHPGDNIEFRKSRYQVDFVEEDPVGKGGFGQVVIARNKLDSHRYAIKKINFSSTKSPRFERIQREVKTLAQFDHPHIVRYYGAWMEEFVHSSDNNIYMDSEGESGSLLIESTIVESQADSESFSQITPPDRPSTPKPTRTIYIQMELCQFTLADWIKQRNHLVFNVTPPSSPPESSENASPPSSEFARKKSLATFRTERMVDINHESGIVSINANECRRTFKQIVKGLVHIHDHGLIHRDLKPQNIFFQEYQDYNLKIGDFGLVSEPVQKDDHSAYQFPTPHGSPSVHSRNSSISSGCSNMTSGLGTITYAAPEQLQGIDYDEKTDIYSLGIILFELFYPFKTQMERAHVLRDLKEQQKFPSSFVRRYPREAAFIWCCVSQDPKLRPSAREIVESEFLEPDAEDLLTLIAAENDTLKTMLEWTERDVHFLHELNQVQQFHIEMLKNQLRQYEPQFDFQDGPEPEISDPESELSAAA